MIERRLKIAVAARNAAGLSGASTLLWEESRRLAAQRHDVHVFAERVDEARLTAAGVRPRRLLRWPWGSRIKRRWFAGRVDRAVRRGGFDLVHGHGDLLNQDVLSLHNCVHTAHERVRGAPLPAGSGAGWMHERQLRGRRFRLLIANSRLMKNDVEQRFGVPPDRVRVVYPGFDPARFRPEDRTLWREAQRRRWAVGEEETVVGLVTSGDFEKRGLPLFLRALAGLPPAVRRRVRAVVVGKETRPAPYLNLMRSLDLGDRVQFETPQVHVEALYHALDVYVHPAPFEEFGMSVQEAMACGVPVLTTRRVGASEFWPGAWNAWLAEAPEVSELSARLAALVEDPLLRRALGAALAPAVRANDWEAHFRSLRACYDEVLDAAGRVE